MSALAWTPSFGLLVIGCLLLVLFVLVGFLRWMADAPQRKALAEWHEAKAEYREKAYGSAEVIEPDKPKVTSIAVRVDDRLVRFERPRREKGDAA